MNVGLYINIECMVIATAPNQRWVEMTLKIAYGDIKLGFTKFFILKKSCIVQAQYLV